MSLVSKRFIILSHISLSLTVFKDSDGIEICDKITLNFDLRQSYHRSGNFRVLNFRVKIFSWLGLPTKNLACENITAKMCHIHLRLVR